MILLLLAILFVILNILDVTTTRTVLRNGGREVNTIARILMRFHLFIPAKTGMAILVLLIMFMSDKDTGTELGIICCVMYGLVVWNNFRAIKRQQHNNLRME